MSAVGSFCFKFGTGWKALLPEGAGMEESQICSKSWNVPSFHPEVQSWRQMTGLLWASRAPSDLQFPHMRGPCSHFSCPLLPFFALCYGSGSLTVLCTPGEARDSERNHRLRSPLSPELSWEIDMGKLKLFLSPLSVDTTSDFILLQWCPWNISPLDPWALEEVVGRSLG